MKISTQLNPFQKELQEHLVRWKWEHISMDQGINNGTFYDSILSDKDARSLPHIYPEIHEELKMHCIKYPFRFHKHFNHMASSQAANINLFLPILKSPFAAEILRSVKPDIDRIATEYLDNGWQIEYCDGFGKAGVLGDKSTQAGTDADIAISYYNHDDELCLWLIEHKLTEAEFTTCGGAKSKGRTGLHRCDSSFGSIIDNKNLCYYHSGSGYNYWNLTDQNRSLFTGADNFQTCPFKGGMNQLWRNLLLALGVEQSESQPYKHASFSVVHHPENQFLNPSITAFKYLIGNSGRFSSFYSEKLILATESTGDTELLRWTNWYRKLYNLELNKG